jgi:DNA-binding MarR family transcriptional regulator
METKDLVDRIVGLEFQINRFLRNSSPDAWMELSLTTAQLKSLFFIDKEGTTNFTKLAAGLGVTSSNVTGIIDRLIEQELVNRNENPDDRRVYLLSLTDKGITLINSLRESRIKKISSALALMSNEELSILANGLSLLVKAVELNERYNSDNPDD